MAKYIENEVAYYYDSHPTEEDLMGETPILTQNQQANQPKWRSGLLRLPFNT
jgi:hypothetical protein